MKMNLLTINYIFYSGKEYDRLLEQGELYLKKHTYNRTLASEIVNVELAKIHKGHKVNVKRITEVKEHTKNKITKAACNCLLSDYDEALKILREALEKNYMELFSIKEFPVYEDLRDKDGYKKLISSFEPQIKM